MLAQGLHNLLLGKEAGNSRLAGAWGMEAGLAMDNLGQTYCRAVEGQLTSPPNEGAEALCK